MFLLRTTTMPSLQKLAELERIVAVDNSGQNVALGAGAARACLVGEFLQGPFVPTIILTPGDLATLYGGDTSRVGRISQSGVDPASAIQDGSGYAWDGNGWMELKGKTFSGLVIQRVDTDMVSSDGGATKAFVKFSVTVAAADQTGGVTNKDIIIPAGTRFADQAIGTAQKVIATSQAVLIPSGTTVTANTIVCGANFTFSPTTGVLTYAATGATTGITAFFVKGTNATTSGGDLIDTAIDTALPNVDAGTVISGTISTIILSGAANDVFAATGAAAPSPDTLSNRITFCYPAAINKTLPGVDATNDIVAIWSARNYQTSGLTPDGAKTMRLNLWNNAIASSNTARGRVACVTAAPATAATSVAQIAAKSAYTGLISADGVVGDNADRYWAQGPFLQVFSTELNADVLISACGTRAAMKVSLANNGQSQFLTSVGTPYNADIQAVDAQEAAFAAFPLLEADYVAMKAAGISWFTRDRAAGWWFYSGVTGVNPVTTSSRVDDNRRSFADEIQDTIFALATRYSKLPGTTERQDAFASDMRVYLESLVNPGVGESRAKQYLVLDGAAAGNTDALNAQGVFLYTVQVVMYGSQKTIVINTAIGTNVTITQSA